MENVIRTQLWPKLLLFATLVALVQPLNALPSQPDAAFDAGWTAYQARDYRKAIDIWKPLAEQGHVHAQINLGVMHEYGKGVSQDAGLATHWYTAAAVQGSVIAQYNLGMFYTTDSSQGTNRKQSLHWLRKSAAQGYADAQFQLGVLHANEATDNTQRTKAANWFYKAGLSYLSNGDSAGIRSAVAAIHQHLPASPLAQKLEAKLAGLPQSNTDQTDSIGSLFSRSVGTAWPVSTGYAVTNNHVVADADEVLLVTAAGEEISATVVTRDEENDVALLAVDDTRHLPPALPLAGAGARLGTSVFTIGFPRVDVMGTTPKLSQGIISGINGLYDDPTSYQISVPIQPGNSGGPLLNMQGEVVGLITSMLGVVDVANGQPQPLPNINFALKINVIEDLLDKVPAHTPAIRLLAVGESTLEALANRIQGSVMIVMAE